MIHKCANGGNNGQAYTLAVDNSGNPPTSCVGLVKIFQHGGYGGWEAPFSKGDYNHGAFTAAGGVNDDASSLKVPTCCKVVLYQHGDYAGWSETFTAGDHNSISHNDDVSSLKVMDDPAC